MKMFRIATPLPMDEIPVSRGETEVDYALTDEMIQYLDDKYNFRVHLGGGDFGIAYATFDNRVVKITTDPEEVKLAEDLMGDSWQKHAPFGRVYEIEKLSENLHVIIKELLTPLDENQESLWMQFIGEYGGDIEEIPESYMENYSHFFQKFDEYYHDVVNYSSFGDTMNPGNIGWDENGNLKAFDPRIV